MHSLVLRVPTIFVWKIPGDAKDADETDISDLFHAAAGGPNSLELTEWKFIFFEGWAPNPWVLWI